MSAATPTADPVLAALQQAGTAYAQQQQQQASQLATAQQTAAEVPVLQGKLSVVQKTVDQQAATITALQQAAANAAASTARPFPGWLAANSSGNQENTLCRWADATRNAGSWYALGGGSLTLTANGYPVGQNIHARSNFNLLGCPAGDYVTTWAGNGTFAPQCAGGVSWKQTSPNSGVLTLANPVTYDGNGNSSVAMWLDILSSDPANPIDALRIPLPGYGPGTLREGQMYRDEHLAVMRRMTGLRSMASVQAGISAAPVNGWAGRRQLASWDWSSMGFPAAGVPWEAEIKLVCEAGMRVFWPCIPIGADDAYITALAQMCHDRLPGVLVIPEFGDELWNWGGGFLGWPMVNGLANTTNIYDYDGAIVNGRWQQTAAGASPVTDTYTRAARCAASLSAHVASLFLAVYADRPGDCAPVLGGCAGNPAWLNEGLKFLTARDGSHPFRFIGIAPYIDHWFNGGYFFHPTGPNNTYQLDDLFAAYNAFISGDTPAGMGLGWQLAQAQGIAQQSGTKVVCYEGDYAGIPASTNPAVDNVMQASRDPRMGGVFDRYYAALHAGGVVGHFGFLPVGPTPSTFGLWAALLGYDDVASPRWQAQVRESIRSN